MLKVVRHASYYMAVGKFNIDKFPKEWGNTYLYKFYEPTETEKRFMFDKIKENGYKYIPVLNKLKKV